MKKHIFSNKHAYTLVELLIVISILGVLASMLVLSYSSWQKSTYLNALKSDAKSVASAMENARNFSSTGYPTSVDSVFTPSKNVNISGGSSDGGKTYCVNLVHDKDVLSKYYIDSNNTTIQAGSCDNTQNILAAPENVVAVNASTSTISVTFNMVPGATGYLLQQSSNASFTDAKTISSFDAAPSLPYLANNLIENTSYYYRVQSTMATKNSAWSLIADARTSSSDVAIPANPTLSQSTPTNDTTFSWSKVSCASGYEARYQYEYSITPDGYDSDWKLIPISVNNLKFTTSTEGPTFALKVRAQCYNVDKNSDWNNGGSITYVRPSAPVTPTMTVTFSDTNVVAAITSSTACKYGTIQYSFRNRTNNGNWGNYSTWSNISSATASAKDDVKYGYQAQSRCTGKVGEYSKVVVGLEYSNARIVTPAKSASITATSSEIYTTWNWSQVSCSAGTVGYQYQYSILPTGYASGWTNLGTTNSITFATNTPGYTFTIQVRANCTGTYATSDWNESVSAAYYRPFSLPGAPINLASNNGANSIDLSWNAPTFNGLPVYSSYNIYRGTASGSETLLANISNASTSYSDSSIAISTNYYYRISAKSSYGESSFSNEITARIDPVLPEAPQGFDVSNCYKTRYNGYSGYGKCTLSWTAPTNANKVTGGVTQYKAYSRYSYYKKHKYYTGWTEIFTTPNLSSSYMTGLCDGSGCATVECYSVSAASIYGEGPRTETVCGYF